MGDEQTYKRAIAYRTTIQDIHSATFLKGEGWDPTLAQLPHGRQAGRVHLLGTIVAKDEQGILLDDGTASIHVRSFNNPELFTQAEIGTVSLVVGKPRTYQEQAYITGEICKKVQNLDWAKVHQHWIHQETQQSIEPVKRSVSSAPTLSAAPKEEKIVVEQPKETSETPNPTKQIYDLIKKHDQGQGAAYETILAEANLDNTETIINHLLEEGAIFELQPGKLKVLD